MKLRLLLGIIALLLAATVTLLSVILYKIFKGLEMLSIFVGTIMQKVWEIKSILEIDEDENTDE
jgi:hypothetical protein